LLTPAMRENWVPVPKLLETKRGVHYTVKTQNKDGKEIDVEAFGAPLKLEGRIQGYLAIMWISRSAWRQRRPS